MNNTMIGALITAGASIILAIVSVINAVIKSKNAAKSARELEELKHKLKMDSQAFEEKKKLSDNYLSALSNSVKQIQKVKDVVQKIINSYKSADHSEVVIRNICDASKELVGSYEECLTSMLIHENSFEKALFHRAKGLSLKIESYVKSALEQKKYASDLSPEENQRLRDMRLELSDIQTQLQNSLSDQLIGLHR